MANRFEQDYILNIKTQVEQAGSSLEKTQILLNSLLSKEQFIKLSVSPSGQETINILKQITDGSNITADAFKNLTDLVNNVVSSFNAFKSKNITSNISALKNPIKEANNQLLAMSNQARTLGVDLSKSKSFSEIVQQVNAANDAVESFIKRFQRTGNLDSKGLDKLINAMELLQKASNSVQDFRQKFVASTVNPITGATVAAEEFNKRLSSTIATLNNVDTKALNAHIRALKSDAEEIQKDFNNIKLKKVLDENDIKTLAYYAELLDHIDSELNKIGANTRAKQLLNNTNAGQNIGSQLTNTQKIVANMNAQAQSAIQKTIDTLVTEASKVDNVADKVRFLFSNYALVNKELQDEVLLLDKIKIAQNRLTNRFANNNFISADDKADAIDKLKKLNEASAASGSKIVQLRQELDNLKQPMLERIQKLRELLNLINEGKNTQAQSLAVSLFGPNAAKSFDDLGAVAKRSKKELRQLGQELGLSNRDMSKTIDLNQKGLDSYLKLTNGVKGFDFFVQAAIERVIRYRIAFAALTKATEGLRNTFNFTKDIEKQMAELSKVLDGQTSNLNELKNVAFDFSKSFGRSIKDVIDIMFIWAQQGKTQNEIIDLTRSTLIGMAGASLTANEAVETLTSAIKVYNLSGNDSVIIFDKLINVQREFAVSTKDLADAMKILGSTAEEFGLNIDSLFGAVTAIVEVTRKTGSQVANALKTIFAKLTEDDVVKSLRDIGVAVFDVQGNLRDFDNVLDDLNLKWATLTESQRVNIARTIGGIRHYTQFVVLMEQYGTKLRAAEASQEALGFTAKAAEKDINTLANQIERLKAIGTQFLEGVGSSTLGFASIVSVIGNVFETLFGKKDNISGLGKAINEITAGLITFGAILGANLSIVLGYKLIVGKTFKAIEGDILDTFSFIGTGFKDFDNQIKQSGKTLLGKAGIGELLRAGFISEEQITKLQRFALGVKSGEQATIDLGHGFKPTIIGGKELVISLEKAGLASESLANKAIVGATAMQKLSISTTRAWQSLLLFGKAIGGQLLWAAGIEAAFLLGKTLFDLHKKIDVAEQSLQNLAEQSIELSRTSNKIEVSLFNASLAFQEFNKQVNESKDFNERQRAIGGLLGQLTILRSLLPELKTITDASISSNKDAAEAEKNRAKVIEIVNNALAERIKKSSELEAKAFEQTAARIEQLTEQQKAFTDLNEAISKFTTPQLDKITIDQSVVDFFNILTENTAQSLDQISNSAIDLGKSLQSIPTAADESNQKLNKLIQDALRIKKIRDDLKKNQPDKFNQLPKEARDIKFNFDESTLKTQLEKILVKFSNQGKTEISIPILIDESTALNHVKAFAVGVAPFIADIDNNFKSINDKIIEYSKNAGLFLGLIGKERLKADRQVAESVSNTIVDIKNLSKEVKKAISDSIIENRNTRAIDIELEKRKEILDRIEKQRSELQKQLQVYNEIENINKTITDEQQNQSLKDIKILLTQQAVLNERISDLQLKTANGIVLTLSEQEDLNRAKIEEATVQERLNKLRKEVGTSDLAQTEESAQKFISLLKQQGNLTDDAVDRLRNQLSLSKQEIVTKRESVELELSLFEARVGGLEAQGKAEYKALQIQKNKLDATEKEIALINKGKELQTFIVNSLVKNLEFGQEAVASLLEIQNTRIQTEIEKRKLINDALAKSIDNVDELDRLQIGIADGTISIAKGLEEVEKAYKNSTTQSEFAFQALKLQIDQLSRAQSLTEDRLNLESRINQIISFSTNSVKKYQKSIEGIRDVQIDIAKSVGDNVKTKDLETQKSKDTFKIQKANLNALEQTLNTLSRLQPQNKSLFDSILQSLRSMSGLQDDTTLGFENIRTELEKIKPLLDSAAERANQVASAFVGAFGSINSTLVKRFEDISNQQENIKTQEMEIAQLKTEQQKRSLALRNTNFQTTQDAEEAKQAYEDITKQVQEAERSLKEMTGDLGRIARGSSLFRDIISNFTTSLGNIFVDIQTNQLKTSLSELLKNSGMVDLFLTASEQGARKYASVLSSAADDLSRKTQAALDASFSKLIQGLQAVLATNSFGSSGIETRIPGATTNFDRAVQGLPLLTNKSKSNTVTFDARTNNLINSSFAASAASIPLLNAISLNTGYTVDSTNKNNKDLNKTRFVQSEGFATLTSAISLLATNFGTALGVKASGNPAAAQSAATGASVGGLVGLGVNALANITGPFGPLISAAGSLLGGLIGGSLGRKPDRPRIKPLEDNTKALKTTTDALKDLNVGFVDLRNELINAPSRFALPAQPGLGFRSTLLNSRSTGNSIPSQGGLVVQFNVQGGFDQSAANSAVQQINEIYSNSARRNSSNTRIFR